MCKHIVIVADAGGTKTDWWIKSDDLPEALTLTSGGINATLNSAPEIEEVVRSLVSDLDSNIPSWKDKRFDLYFYGAGCNSSSTKSRLEDSFRAVLESRSLNLSFYSDLEGAARALFGNEKGIACILGTGSASGYYDGEKLIESIPSLGFILGDEGSGAYMGKILINRLYKRDLTPKIKGLLEEFLGLNLPGVLESVYRLPAPNRFLASLVPFIKQHEKDEEIDFIIKNSLKLFFVNNVLKYSQAVSDKIRFVGGIAYLFSSQIREVASMFDLNVDRILIRPIEALGHYHYNIHESKI